jgi:putative redox protein
VQRFAKVAKKINCTWQTNDQSNRRSQTAIRNVHRLAYDRETKHSAIASWQSKIWQEGSMTEAKAIWQENHRFEAIATSGHTITVDGDKAAGNSPMELVLIGLCGCTAYDVVSILQKKREPFASLEVRAEAERAKEPPSVYTEIKLIYRVGGKVSRKAVEDAVRLSKEKYCSVSAMLAKTAKITAEIEYADA